MNIKIYQNLWKAAKTVLRVKLLALNAHITKEEKCQIYVLSALLKNVGGKGAK